MQYKLNRSISSIDSFLSIDLFISTTRSPVCITMFCFMLNGCKANLFIEVSVNRYSTICSQITKHDPKIHLNNNQITSHYPSSPSAFFSMKRKNSSFIPISASQFLCHLRYKGTQQNPQFSSCNHNEHDIFWAF